MMLLSLPPSAKESGTCPTMMLSAIAICVLACTFFAPEETPNIATSCTQMEQGPNRH